MPEMSFNYNTTTRRIERFFIAATIEMRARISIIFTSPHADYHQLSGEVSSTSRNSKVTRTVYDVV
jgi:hypothetical protein